jgi:SET domain-containing protein
MKKTTSKWAVAKTSAIHNMGMFASKKIPEDAKILEYVGEKITKKESDIRADVVLSEYKADENTTKGGVYIFTLDKKFDIDGNVDWNTARYINHSCNPNCEAVNEDGHIWIMALRDIKKGEELCYNYGYDVDNFEEHPCKCGSIFCVGYIVSEEDWPELRSELHKKGIF